MALARGDRTYLVAGQLDPRVAEIWELPAETFIAEIDLAVWQESSRPPRVAAPPRFPVALRDLAVVVGEAAQDETLGLDQSVRRAVVKMAATRKPMRSLTCRIAALSSAFVVVTIVTSG